MKIDPLYYLRLRKNTNLSRVQWYDDKDSKDEREPVEDQTHPWED